MGADKALVEIEGMPMLVVAHQALVRAGASRRIVVGGDEVSYRRVLPGLVTVPDEYPGEGPLGGIITALRRLSHEQERQAEARVVILACDLPGVCASSVAAVLDVMDSHPGAQVCVPAQRGRLEPLHAVWRPSALPQVEAAFGAGERAVHAVIESIEAVVVEDLDEAWLRNVNSPDDLAR